MKQRLLILSFSQIYSDARVLKQVHAFAEEYDVTTCGYGGSPDPRVVHCEMTPLPADHGRRTNLILRRYALMYENEPAVRSARAALRGAEPFDLVLANDVDSLGLALALRPARGVHADLHEYSPRLNEELVMWRLFIAPYMRWMCRRFLPRVASITTVGQGIADEYRRRFGVASEVVNNAAPYVDHRPTLVEGPIRLVHSGAALRNRRLDVTVRAVLESSCDATLDLYLMPNDPVYLDELKTIAGEDPRVTFHEPVPYERLIGTLNGYDVGVHVIPPTNFNNKWALPNKLFDYVQARLGILVGPTKEMADVVADNDIGIVAESFDAAAVRSAIERIDVEAADLWKRNADASAHRLSAGPQVDVWRRAIAELADRDR